MKKENQQDSSPLQESVKTSANRCTGSIAGTVTGVQGITTKSSDITYTEHSVTVSQRAWRNRHEGGLLWLTGLSGSGKSTLAFALEKELFDASFQAYTLDGDNIRHGLNADLGFSADDRTENIRRVGEVALLFADAGMIAIAAFISPYAKDRDNIRKKAKNFHEVYIKADLATCESRDPKGLYKRARAGMISEFTGINTPYEPPLAPELTIDTQILPVAACLQQLLDYVQEAFRITGRSP